jgi:hypothetical protein
MNMPIHPSCRRHLANLLQIIAAALFLLICANARHSAAQTWSISPGSASVNESAGSVTFTVTRSSGSAAQTVYVSTTQTEGFSNSGDYNLNYARKSGGWGEFFWGQVRA